MEEIITAGAGYENDTDENLLSRELH